MRNPFHALARMLSVCSPSITCAAINLLLRFFSPWHAGVASNLTVDLWSGLVVLQFNPRVEPSVENVGKEVGKDHREGDDQEDSLHQRIVSLIYCLAQHAADAPYSKICSTNKEPPTTKPIRIVRIVKRGRIALRPT